MLIICFPTHSSNRFPAAMMFSKKGEGDDKHENSDKDTSFTNMADYNDTAPHVQTCNGNRDLCADDRQRTLARV